MFGNGFAHWPLGCSVSVNAGDGGRVIAAAMDGSDVRVVDHSGRTSHLIWRDPAHILAWSWHVGQRGGYTVFEDKPEGGDAVGRERQHERASRGLRHHVWHELPRP